MIYEGHNILTFTGDKSSKTGNHWMVFFFDVVPRDPLLPVRVLMIYLQELLAHFFVNSYTFEVFGSSARQSRNLP
jgi:hypothetical protein